MNFRAIRMSDNPMDSLPAYNRVSIRAVLVTDGQDPRAALAEAGIFDPVEVAVVIGDDLSLSDGLLGDAITQNLTAVLEPDEADDWGSSASVRPGQTSASATPHRPEKPAVATPETEFGRRPFAPAAARSAY
jgi:hypothetical protein